MSSNNSSSDNYIDTTTDLSNNNPIDKKNREEIQSLVGKGRKKTSPLTEPCPGLVSNSGIEIIENTDSSTIFPPLINPHNLTKETLPPTYRRRTYLVCTTTIRRLSELWKNIVSKFVAADSRLNDKKKIRRGNHAQKKKDLDTIRKDLEELSFSLPENNGYRITDRDSTTECEDLNKLDVKQQIRKIKRNQIKNLLIFGLSFLLITPGFTALRYLQATFNHRNNIGPYSLCCFEAMFALTSLFSDLFPKRFQTKNLIAFSFMGNIFYVLSNFKFNVDFLLPISSAFLGFTTALQSTSGTTYLASFSIAYSRSFSGKRPEKTLKALNWWLAFVVLVSIVLTNSLITITLRGPAYSNDGFLCYGSSTSHFSFFSSFSSSSYEWPRQNFSGDGTAGEGKIPSRENISFLFLNSSGDGMSGISDVFDIFDISSRKNISQFAENDLRGRKSSTDYNVYNRIIEKGDADEKNSIIGKNNNNINNNNSINRRNNKNITNNNSNRRNNKNIINNNNNRRNSKNIIINNNRRNNKNIKSNTNIGNDINTSTNAGENYYNWKPTNFKDGDSNKSIDHRRSTYGLEKKDGKSNLTNRSYHLSYSSLSFQLAMPGAVYNFRHPLLLYIFLFASFQALVLVALFLDRLDVIFCKSNVGFLEVFIRSFRLHKVGRFYLLVLFSSYTGISEAFFLIRVTKAYITCLIGLSELGSALNFYCIAGFISSKCMHSCPKNCSLQPVFRVLIGAFSQAMALVFLHLSSTSSYLRYESIYAAIFLMAVVDSLWKDLNKKLCNQLFITPSTVIGRGSGKTEHSTVRLSTVINNVRIYKMCAFVISVVFYLFSTDQSSLIYNGIALFLSCFSFVLLLRAFS